MRALAAFLVLVLAGCAGMPTIDDERKTVSSGLIGCAPEEIAVSNHERFTWTAMCKGRTFHCLVGPTTACTQRMQ